MLAPTRTPKENLELNRKMASAVDFGYKIHEFECPNPDYYISQLFKHDKEVHGAVYHGYLCAKNGIHRNDAITEIMQDL